MRLWGISKKKGEKVGDSAKNAYLCSALFGKIYNKRDYNNGKHEKARKI